MALLTVTAAGSGRMAPTGGVGGQHVRERLAAGGWISMSHLSIVKIGGEAGDFKHTPPIPVFCLYLAIALTLWMPAQFPCHPETVGAHV